MRSVVLLLGLGLFGCNTPSADFRGIVAQRITVDGSTFDIRVRDELAEAVRINVQYAPRMGPIEARAARAMATVSGCRVVRVTGDQALALGQLDCNDRPRDYRPPLPLSVECERIADPLRVNGRPQYANYDCAAI